MAYRLAGLLAAAIAASDAGLALAAVSFSGDTTVSPQQVLVGNSGFGTFRIDGGSTFSSNSMLIGGLQSGVGIATVTGGGSQWNITGGGLSDVGSSGIGRLEILDGGIVTATQSAQMRVAVNVFSHGTVIVDGQGSLLSMNNLSIGASSTSSGSALVRISNGGIVNLTSSQTQISPLGRVELSDGLFRTGQLINNGVIAGSGEVLVQATSGATNTGRMEAGAGEMLKISGPVINFQNQGILQVEGGEMEFVRPVMNVSLGETAGEITLRDGTIRMGTANPFGPELTNSAVLAATGGVNDFYGSISNGASGRIAVTNESVLIFHDDVTANGGVITVFPGSSAVFLNDLTVDAEATLLADLAGTGTDTGFGEIEVVGTAQLSGSLQVTLAEGFTPEAGDTFALLAASQISGSLTLGEMPALPQGLLWNLETEAHRVVLSVVPGLAGDYNGDGSVDAADYVVWRAMEGQMGAGLAADGNGDHVVDGDDYEFWQSNFGASLAGQAPLGGAVPEPHSIMLLLSGLLLVVGRERVLHY
jgi:T5SS/PEP-CTERM-associated repeat protein